MGSPTVQLMSVVASLFECDKYSDLTIVCGTRRYRVHRALVCSHSEFFEGACRNPFQEWEAGVIDLTEDDPEAVEHMVTYFYHLDYLTNSISRHSSWWSSRPILPLSQHYRTYQKPEKFRMAMVKDPLMAMVSAASTAQYPITPPEELSNDFNSNGSSKVPDTAMADQNEAGTFESISGLSEPEAGLERPHITIHAKVYAIAEKYGIAGLKSLARKRFAHQIQLHVNSPELPNACQEAYETTVDSDRGLRDIVIQTFRAHPDLALRKDVEMVVRETPGLAFELYRMASGLPVTSWTA